MLAFLFEQEETWREKAQSGFGENFHRSVQRGQ